MNNARVVNLERHMPYACEETHIMLLEPATTLNTGNLQNERTVAQLERI